MKTICILYVILLKISRHVHEVMARQIKQWHYDMTIVVDWDVEHRYM